jgi:hypothetical protein
MRGHIRKRYKDSWNIILDKDYQLVPNTGNMKHVQKWFTVHRTKRDAERKLANCTHPNTPHGHLATLQQRLKAVDEMHSFSMICSGGAVFERIQRMREEMASAHFLSS